MGVIGATGIIGPREAVGAGGVRDRAGGAERSLVVIRDADGRRRGTGFVADHHGTVLTSHEVVEGAAVLAVTTVTGRTCEVGTADAVTPLPDLDLAVIRTEGLDADPLPVTVRTRIEPGTYVRLAACGWREARVLGVTPVTYTAADGRRRHPGEALELAIGTTGRDALRPGGGATGGPVLDAATGTVLGVLGTGLRPGGERRSGLAVPLCAPGPPAPARPGAAPGAGAASPAGPARRGDSPLTVLLARNAATVPAYGADLNLAGILADRGDGGHRAPAPEELADWLQGSRLDLGEALRARLGTGRTGPGDAGRPEGGGEHRPLPDHRVAPVGRALLILARRQATAPLAERLAELLHALETDPGHRWAAPLLTQVLAELPDATPCTAVLRGLADLLTGPHGERRPVPAEFGPPFWAGLRLPYAERLDLLRRLVVTDEAPRGDGLRHLDTAARLLTADPVAVQPHLVRWFGDERPLHALPRATVAAAAQALLHTHRHLALDDLVEALGDGAHRPRAAELLGGLAEEEPSAVCRAVERWARDEHPPRRATAAVYGRLVAPHARTGTDRELLCRAALALLSRPSDTALHNAARALLDQVRTAA
ncbi:serine protease [Streptomyces sp. NPDC047000]|uniref:serine protease n=1 Tax=Streptomyces sp. NPDC047000 TaxID=3155474 RepID=UPI0033EDAE92